MSDDRTQWTGAYPSTTEHRPAPRPRESRRSLVIGAAALAGALLVAVAVGAWMVVQLAGRDKPSQPAAAAASASNADPAGHEACKAVRDLTDGLYDPNVVTPIAIKASQSTDFDIATYGRLMKSGAELAKAAKGSADEASTTLGMATSGMDLQTTCITKHY